MARKQAVITGIGVISAAGIGQQEFWQNMCSGQSFIAPITQFDTTKFASKVAGSVLNFDAHAFIDSRIIAQTDRWTHFDLVCAQQALTDAQLQLTQEDPQRVGIVFSAGTGGNTFGQRQLHLCWEKGPRYVSAYQSIAWFYAASIGQVSIAHAIRGYGRNICAEAAGGLIALALAAKIIQQNLCDVVLVGGSEAPLAPYIFACHEASQLISTETGTYPYRPFDALRTGPVIGEGGAAFCIESKEHAQRRGAIIYAEIAGGGQTFDGSYEREPVLDGQGYARALRIALQHACIEPDTIDWIICDGLGTQRADIAEVNALYQVFGASLSGIPASAPKSMIGRLFNGASPVDVAAALLGMKHSMVLPTVGYSYPDMRCEIDCVPNSARAHTVERVLVGARGFGGFNAALVLTKPRDEQPG